ncbi:endo-polygalacturonase [Ascoidea rubescens DSM 1968]|uniref:endo-polygalacturonase n=1 Tax=Ascoidea rubescens DSM 1968 TaxID=1344418 RepID=A0A1D2VK30_9ASCO|nr:glycoside hydrolase family 28 protein [Ascoidea rubescens DSM 1968]ODV61960.1 glycoside hydrolase family 28 protein [Ascoidea rubescens DSM 1968]
MKLLASLSILLAILSNVSSRPLEAPKLSKRDDCIINTSSFGSISSIQKNCKTIVVENLTVPKGKTLDLSSLKEGSTVTFKGKTTFEYKEWKGPLIKISGKKIKVTGKSGHVIDGDGSRWWDGKGGNGGKTKPKFFAAHKMIDSTIEGLNIKNTPVHCFSINNVQNLVISGIVLDIKDGDSNGGHNTDAFDVGSSTGVTIKDSTIYNQDDCLAVNSGNDITFTNNYCSGGHGISIGSVGGRSNNVVDGVSVSDCQIVDSDNGVRIKTVYGATGKVNNVKYENITLKDIIKYGIVIQGDYENGSPTGTPTGGVPITNLTIKNVTGNVKSTGQNIYILVKNASKWTWSNVNVTGASKIKKQCTGIPSGSGASC